jgi:hypothetical protein
MMIDYKQGAYLKVLRYFAVWILHIWLTVQAFVFILNLPTMIYLIEILYKRSVLFL